MSNQFAHPGDPPILSLTVYHSKGNNDNGHDLEGWYWWAAATDHPRCWFGDPEGPFSSPEQALQNAASYHASK